MCDTPGTSLRQFSKAVLVSKSPCCRAQQLHSNHRPDIRHETHTTKDTCYCSNNKTQRDIQHTHRHTHQHTHLHGKGYDYHRSDGDRHSSRTAMKARFTVGENSLISLPLCTRVTDSIDYQKIATPLPLLMYCTGITSAISNCNNEQAAAKHLSVASRLDMSWLKSSRGSKVAWPPP